MAESIFLTSQPVRIRAVYNNVLDEISPTEIEYVRTLYPNYDMYSFIVDKTNALSWADEIVIETFEK